MTLYNKDGTPYKLNTYNELMINQNLWNNKDQIIFYNKFGNKIIYDKNLNLISGIKEESPPIIKKEVKKIELDNKIESNNKMEIWCLPAYYVEKIDPLYRESHKKIKYGDKFIFEGILKSQTDFNIHILTSIDNLSKGSIIFPRNKDKRWWQIDEIIKNNNNLNLIIGSITNIQPSFS